MMQGTRPYAGDKSKRTDGHIHYENSLLEMAMFLNHRLRTPETRSEQETRSWFIVKFFFSAMVSS